MLGEGLFSVLKHLLSQDVTLGIVGIQISAIDALLNRIDMIDQFLRLRWIGR